MVSFSIKECLLLLLAWYAQTTGKSRQSLVRHPDIVIAPPEAAAASCNFFMIDGACTVIIIDRTPCYITAVFEGGPLF